MFCDCIDDAAEPTTVCQHRREVAASISEGCVRRHGRLSGTADHTMPIAAVHAFPTYLPLPYPPIACRSDEATRSDALRRGSSARCAYLEVVWACV